MDPKSAVIQLSLESSVKEPASQMGQTEQRENFLDSTGDQTQVNLQFSQEQPESEEPKSLVRSQWLKLLLVLFGSSLICTTIGLGCYSHWKVYQATVPCVSPACLRVAEHFSAVMDPFSHPCDYFLFTCGSEASTLSRGRQRGKITSHNNTTGQGSRRWTGGAEVETESETKKERDDVSDWLPDRRTALLQKIKEILESPVRSLSVNSAEQKAQMFYNTCMEYKVAESLSSKRFLTLIEQLGGWAVSGRWTQPDFNTTLAMLMAQYDTFPFFNVYVGPDNREGQSNGSQRYIQIDQPDFQFPIDWNSKTHRSKINTQSLRPFISSCRQVLDLLDVHTSHTTHCGLYVSLCSTLVTATLPLDYRLRQKLLYHRITIQELQLLAPAINWLYCLQTIFHPLPISQSDFVLLHNLPYIIHMSLTINVWKPKYESMGSDPLHTYMILTLLQTLMPAMDSRFTQIMKNFPAAIDSREEYIIPWKHCVLQTAKGFNTWLSYVIKEHYARAEAEELMHDIYSTFKTKVVDLSWKNEEMRDLILNKINSFTPRLSTNTGFLVQLNIDKHYTEVIMNDKDYFPNYLQLLGLQQKRRRRLLSHTAQHDVLLISPFISGNDIIVPAGLFVSPLFHPSYPRAINYGMLGSLIAKDLVHLLLPDILSQSESPKLDSECVWSHYVSGQEDAGRLSQSQQQEVWVQYSALQVAVQAYHTSLQRHSGDTSVSGLSHIHLFLISFIQASCESEPYRSFMPFEPSFLVTVLCRNSDFCPKPLICEAKPEGHLPERCSFETRHN